MSSTPIRLILASASPRRRELLSLLGLPFEVVPSRYKEPSPPQNAISLPGFVSELAVNKAREVASRIEHSIVLGADTLVTLASGDTGVPLGKPESKVDAMAMLQRLSGKEHTVFTGLALIRVQENGDIAAPHIRVTQTQVRFRSLDDAMIADYVETGESLDKAGAYGAQGYAAPFIESFHGDFYNVVGLPLCTLGLLLEEIGVEWWRYRSQMPPIIG